MVDWKVRNTPEFFQVQKKSGTYFFFVWSEARFLKFLNDPKIEKILLLQITQNGPIRENKWLKPKSGTFFWDYWMTLPLQWLEASRLTVVRGLSFFCNFFEKIFFAQNDSEWFNSRKKVVENEIWVFRPPIGSLGPRLSHFSKIF